MTKPKKTLLFSIMALIIAGVAAGAIDFTQKGGMTLARLYWWFNPSALAKQPYMDAEFPVRVIINCEKFLFTGFPRELKFGDEGEDVKCIQTLLNGTRQTQIAFFGANSPGEELASLILEQNMQQEDGNTVMCGHTYTMNTAMLHDLPHQQASQQLDLLYPAHHHIN